MKSQHDELDFFEELIEKYHNNDLEACVLICEKNLGIQSDQEHHLLFMIGGFLCAIRTI